MTYRYGSPGVPAVTIHMNGETVDFIPMMPSHTAGDTIVRFNKANVIYIEDFYRNFGYPFADQANGGSIKGMIEAVDLIEKLAGPDTTLIPGHGTLVKKKDLLRLPRHARRHPGKGAEAARPGQVAGGSSGREPDGALRRDDAGRHEAEQGPVHHRGVRRGEETFRLSWTANEKCQGAPGTGAVAMGFRFGFLLTIAAVAAVFAQQVTDSAAEVLALEKKIEDAVVRGDVSYVESVLASDFRFVHGDGWTTGGKPLANDDKAAFLNASRIRNTSSTISTV